MNKWAITTSKARGKQGLGLSNDAQRLAEELQIPVIPRDNKGIAKLMQFYQLDVLLIEEEEGLVSHWADGQTLSYHPGMAVPRIRHMKDGEPELLAQVMDLSLGDHVLDCTMGMASDAVTISYALGPNGSVTALESSPVIYAVTGYGLSRWNWPQESKIMRETMDRVTPIYGKYESYLQQLTGRPFDVIYFDPMFERPIAESSGIAPLRREADYAPLTQETLALAQTLCRKRVVVKHREGTAKHLQFDEVLGGKYSNLAYGILYAASTEHGNEGE